MSHHSGNYGGQCPSGPLTTKDKIIIGIGIAVICTVLFGPPVFGVVWWVFG